MGGGRWGLLLPLHALGLIKTFRLLRLSDRGAGAFEVPLASH